MMAMPEILKYTDGMEIKPGIYDGMPEEVYRAADGLNFSSFKDFFKPNGSPGTYKAIHFDKVIEQEDKDALIVGRGIHEKTLFGSFDCTKYPEVFLAGKRGSPTETTIANSAAVMNCAAALHSRPSFRKIYGQSYKELSIFAICPKTGLLLKMKGDLVFQDFTWIFDIKSCGDFERLFKPWGELNWKGLKYAYQAVHYSYTAHLATGLPLPKFSDILVGKKYPYQVKFMQFYDLETVTFNYHMELSNFAQCFKNGTWDDDFEYFDN